MSEKRMFSLVLLIVSAISVLGAQTAPPSAGELTYRLASPLFLGGGSHLTVTGVPQAAFLNPAAAAGLQRTVVDGSCMALVRFGSQGSGGSGFGHSVNLGLSVPTRRGVLTGGFSFLDTSAFLSGAMNLGMSGRAFFAFSRELYSDIWVGVSLDGSLGSLNEKLDGGAALNAGFLHFPEAFWNLGNFRWGASISGLGYRYGSGTRGYFNALPGNLTPALGLAFDVVNRDVFKWTFRGDVRVPSLSDLWVGIGSDLAFGDAVRLSVSASLSLRDSIAGSIQSGIPAASLAVRFPLGGSSDGEGLNLTEMDIQAVASPLYDDVWAFGGGGALPFGVRDEDAPEMTTDIETLQYISPNYDGVQDELIIPYDATDARYIVAYTWRVMDEAGNVVRTYVNKDERPENESVRNLWTRLISPREGTPLPEVFRWDGVTDAGAVAPDGEYAVMFEFRDDNDNVFVSDAFPVVLDTQAPELVLDEPEGLDLIFSPDGDGYKDTFAIAQEGSEEHLWTEAFVDAAGIEVRSIELTDAAPGNFSWDGRGLGDAIVNDGVYRYVVTATDRAGNSVEAAVEGIIVDTQQPEVGLSIDRAVFSPETSSEIASVQLTPDIPVRDGIVDWSLDIRDAGGRSVYSWSRRENPVIPESFTFDGKDSSGRVVSEGRYTAELVVEYGNGFRPSVESPLFSVDLTAPEASVTVDWNLFSPQGGSRRSEVTYNHSFSDEPGWDGVLSDSNGAEVKRWGWIGNPPAELSWDGRDAEGRLVADGSYSYRIESTDRAGNFGFSEPVTVRVDTSELEASLTASLDVFGPTGNGVNDELSFFPRARTDSPVKDWSLVLSYADGTEVRSWSGEGTPPDEVVWSGRNAAGSAAADGAYRVRLTVNYVRGDEAVSSAVPVILDTVPPELSARAAATLFSPDGDGSRDTLEIRQSSSSEAGYQALLTDSSGVPRRSWTWSESLDSVSWDGTDDSGNVLPDGDYTYLVEGRDEAGNQASAEIRGIRIDTAPTPVYLTAAEGYIKAGETDPERLQSFAAVVPNSSGIDSWSFSIMSESDSSVSRSTGEGEPPSSFTWNGTDQAGRPVEGTFTGVLDVVYAKGARPRAESRSFVSDGSPPNIDTEILPSPFSPDGDNVDDEVVIALKVEDQSRIRDWSLVIADPRGEEFIVFSGRGRPSERIIWDGRSGRGDLVQSAEDHPYELTVTDILGQMSTRNGMIPVDVLVIREGHRLKIQINNITFRPSSPGLTTAGEEGEKNREVLDRLAEIMQKYSSYRIVVEGHAAMLNWENPAAAEREQRNILLPLSRSRARTVVDELIARGISAARLSAEGLGGSEPIVPHGNVEERWKNRRVEFYLEK